MADNKKKPMKFENAPQQPAQSEERRGSVNFTMAVPARVEEIVGHTGTRGEACQVRCKILDGRDKNKTMRRNARGPIQIGDILMLRETEIEARPLNKMGRGNQ
jgi:small subunit ribosomal protein S28e